jgi:RHS repeat-associated protein
MQKLSGLGKKKAKKKKHDSDPQNGAHGGPSAPPKKKPADAGDTPAQQQQNNSPRCNGTHPVYLITGENFDRYVDFAPGTLFEWRRHYTSARGHRDGPLGHGWRHYYQRTLQRRLHRAKFTNWDGAVTQFGRFELGEDTTRADGYVLRRLGLGHFVLSRRGEPELEFRGGEFDNQVPLVRISSPAARLDLEYDVLKRLSALVETPADPAQQRRRFELRYDVVGHITHVMEIDPNAPPITNGSNQGPRTIARAAYTYSPAHDLVRAEDSLGGRWTYEYDAFHHLTQQTDARGYRYDYGYDASGRCIRASGEDGLWWCKIEYFPEKQYTRYTEGDNATWEYHYNSEGTATKVVDPYGGALERRVDESGRIVTEVDSGGRTLEWMYDNDGCHYGRLDEYGNLYPPESVQPKLPELFVPALPSTALGWLLEGRAAAHADALLGMMAEELAALPPDVQRFATACFRLRAGGAQPAQQPLSAPRITLDSLGRKVLEVDAIGRRRQWSYDATGNVVASVDRDGHRSTQDVVSWNLIGARIDALGNAVTYRHDKLEQIITLTDPLGNETRYDYDLKQRLARVHRHGVVREEYVYDGGDHFIEKRDGAGNVLFTNTVHENHRVATRKLASGGEHLFDYDEKGRVVEASTEAHVVRMSYGLSGSLTSDKVDGAGIERTYVGSRSASTSVLARFEHCIRFGAGVTTLVHSDGRTTRIEHQQPGLVKRRCANGTTEVLQFNEAGALEASLRYRPARIAGHHSRAIRYVYSGEGDLLEVTDTELGTTAYEVDAAHGLVGERSPDGRRLSYPRDAAGNLISTPVISRIEIGPGNRLHASSREHFRYDERNHLSERSRYIGPTREAATTRYSYDSYDMLVRIDRHEPRLPLWVMRLQSDDVATAALDDNPDRTWQTWSAEYDALDRRLVTRWVAADGVARSRRFYWDGDRLAAELSPDGALRIYEYATDRALVPIAFTDYASVSAPSGSGRTYHVFVNPVGVPLAIEDRDGSVVWAAQRVDPYGTVTVKPGALLEYNLRWPGHYFDPETGLHYNRHRYYDPQLGRYLQSDPIGYQGSPVNLYAYCPNPLVQVDVLGLDHDGQSSKSNDQDKGKQDKPPKFKDKNPAGETINPSTGLTTKQQQDYNKKKADAKKLPQPQQDAALRDARHERHKQRCENRDPPTKPMDRSTNPDPNSDEYKQSWDGSHDRVHENQKRGREHEDNALGAMGLKNNNLKDGDDRPELFDGTEREGQTRPDALSDKAVVDVKSVPPGPGPDGKPRTVYNTEQLKDQQAGKKPGQSHVTVISSDGPAENTRPSGPLAENSTVLHRDNETGKMSHWDPNGGDDGSGGWNDASHDDVRDMVGGDEKTQSEALDQQAKARAKKAAEQAAQEQAANAGQQAAPNKGT